MTATVALTPAVSPRPLRRGDPAGPVLLLAVRSARPDTCGCTRPLFRDPLARMWRHLADGTPCTPPHPAAALPPSTSSRGGPNR